MTIQEFIALRVEAKRPETERLTREFWERVVLQVAKYPEDLPLEAADAVEIAGIADALTAEWRKRFVLTEGE